MDNNLLYQLALTQVKGIGAVHARNLISYCGGVNNIFSKPRQFLQKIPGIGSILAQNIKAFRDFDRLELEMEFMTNNNIRSLFFLDDEYPVRLKNIPDSPILLFTKGNTNLNPERCIGIVGTRKMTTYGKSFVHRLIADLAPLDVTVVSGLAYGVDVHAHKKCVEHNVPTFGIVAHGLDQMYPQSHAGIARAMIQQNGAILTEYFSGTEPFHAHFPCRNRIVAGMVDALIVVESAKRGGSLITAELANQYNRDVFALPGSIGSTYSSGCNYLIKNHKAQLIENIEDLIKHMNWDVQVRPKPQRQLFIDLTETQQKLLKLIKTKTEVGVDDLLFKSGLSSSSLAMTLLELEMKNCISSLPGKRYQVI